MIFDTSYSDKETKRKIDTGVGPAFSWKARFKMGGIGSRRMTIHGISESYKSFINAAHYISTANIELRPKGVIIHFRHKLQAYSWIMPYASIKITYEDLLKLESDDHFIQFNEPQNDQFINKMITLHQQWKDTNQKV